MRFPFRSLHPLRLPAIAEASLECHSERSEKRFATAAGWSICFQWTRRPVKQIDQPAAVAKRFSLRSE